MAYEYGTLSNGGYDGIDSTATLVGAQIACDRAEVEWSGSHITDEWEWVPVAG